MLSAPTQPEGSPNAEPSIAVAYLARGATPDCETSFQRFLDSYSRHPAGREHVLYVLFKGFPNPTALRRAQAMFQIVEHRPMMLDDDKLDIGAYIEWANRIEADLVCPFNTASEILASHWLIKLALNLASPGVGLVGATASYESLNNWNPVFPPFPNIHLRSTAFMLDRRVFCRYTDGLTIREKLDAFHFESGPQSLSQYVRTSGREVLIVGRNGRGYGPTFWPASDTFRLGFQRNLLVGDNQTRNFLALTWLEKRETVIRTWGRHLRDFQLLETSSATETARNPNR